MQESSKNTEPDAQAAGSIFVDLYSLGYTPGADLVDVFDSINRRVNTPLDDPEWVLTGSASGSSPDGVPEWTFIDWFYMAGPTLAKIGQLCESPNAPIHCLPSTINNNPYWNKLFELYRHMSADKYYDLSSRESVGQHLRFYVSESSCLENPTINESVSLFWHDMNKAGECSKVWSRGVGWVVAAYAETLQSIGDSYASTVLVDTSHIPATIVWANRSEEGNGALNIQDQDSRTRWSCENITGLPTCEVTLGLDETVTAATADIHFYRGNLRKANFDLYRSDDSECSSDGFIDWIQVRDDEWSSGNIDGSESFSLYGSEVRCLRYVGRGNTENNWNSIIEFSIAPYNGGSNQSQALYSASQVLSEDFRSVANALVALQRADGFWNPALFDAVIENPGLSVGVESSGTALITYALAKGVNLGVLDRTRFLPIIMKAWDALQAKALLPVSDEGVVMTYVQGVAQAPPVSAVTIDDMVNGDHPERQYALGAFLLAASEIAGLEKLPITFAAGPPHENGNKPANILDDNLSTRWSAEGVDDEFGWVAVNLGEIYSNVNRVDIAWFRGDQRKAFFDLEYSGRENCMGSQFDLEFYPIPNATRLVSSGNTLQSESFYFPPIAAKCIRYQGRGNTENNWNSVTELAVYSPVFPLATGLPVKVGGSAVRANRWEEPNNPENVVDLDFESSRWACENVPDEDDCLLWIDLGESRSLSEIRIRFYKPERLEYFEIETSADINCMDNLDPNIWQNRTYDIGNSSSGIDVVGMSGRRARCVLFRGLGNHLNNWNSIYDFSIYTMPGDQGVEKIALDIADAASATELPNVASNTLDSDLETRWSCWGIAGLGEESSCWIVYDLGGMETVADIKTAWYMGDERTAYFDLQYSRNGIDWINTGETESPDLTAEVQSIVLESFQAQYIRYIGRGNSNSYWNSITEFEVYRYH